ncbi:MAG TPA: hypothetical protein VMY76_00740 [Gemmatimonadales bacterium]|nr:hypothetical protein [Gemmatimonadales bacterium]
MRFPVAVLAVVLLVGCEPPEQEGELNIGFQGRWTNPNDLRAPAGAALTADNVVSDRPGIAEPRRGFTTLAASLSGSVNALAYFSGYVVAHHGSAAISRTTDGTAWTAYSGSYSPPDSSTPVTFREAEGSLFVTTSAGVYELDSPTGTWRKTGAPAGLDGTATLNRTSGTSGFATAGGQWAYRDVWVKRNANNRLQFGAPSGRQVVVNPASVTVAIGGLVRAGTTVTATVTSHPYVTGDVIDLSPGEANFASGQKTITGTTSTTFTYTEAGAAVASTAQQTTGFTARLVTRTVRIPSEITSASGWVVQVYRSGKSASASDTPTDNMGLVIERAPTNLDIANGYMTLTDYATDDLRGATLYTTEQGLVAAKTQPPVCHDFSSYRQSYWCADTNRNQRLLLTLLAVGGSNGVSGNHVLYLRSQTAGTFGAAVLFGSSESIAGGQAQIYTTGTVGQNIQDTAQSIVRVINGNSTLRATFRAFYASSSTEAPGAFVVETIDPAAGPWFAYVFRTSGAATLERFFAPDLPNETEITTLQRAANVVTAATVVAHGLTSGQSVYIESGTTPPDANFPEGAKTITVTGATTFTYAEAGANATAGTTYVVFDRIPADGLARNDDWSNSLHYSSPDEPWSFPVAQQIFVGSRGTTIKRLIPTADRLLVWTDNGLYKVTGTYPYFSVSEVDVNLKLLARGLAGSLGDRGYGYTDQGFVEALDTATVRSIPIEAELRDLQASAASNIAARSFSVSYESDRRWLAWMPSNSSDTYATQAQVYNRTASLAGGQDVWTRWPVNATCGFIHPTENKLYLGTSTGAVWVERKSRTASDYQDPGGAAISSTVEWLPNVDDSSKFWPEGALDFKSAQFSTSTLYFQSDLASAYDAGTTITPPLGATSEPARIPFWVSMEMRRGTRLKVKWNHATASESYALQGLSLKFRKTAKEGR